MSSNVFFLRRDVTKVTLMFLKEKVRENNVHRAFASPLKAQRWQGKSPVGIGWLIVIDLTTHS